MDSRKARRKLPKAPAPGFVEVARVVAPFGVRGEFKASPSSDVPHRFSPGRIVYMGGVGHRIQRSRQKGQALVLKLEGIDSLETASELRGSLLEVPESDVPPAPRGTYYYFQVLGMAVYTLAGEHLGVVTEILATGANDVYVVRQEEREVLIPAIAQVVRQVDVQGKRMTVDLPPGLR